MVKIRLSKEMEYDDRFYKSKVLSGKYAGSGIA